MHSQTAAPFPTISFLKVAIHKTTMNQVLDWMETCIQDRNPRLLCTMNAALLVWAQKDPFLLESYQQADLVTCDSTVVHYALKILGKPVPEPLEACQIMFDFIKKKYHKGYAFYFLGARKEFLDRAVVNLKNRYPGIQIKGSHHGYFNETEEEGIVEEIKRLKPDCLFVGMSSPLKEKFLRKRLEAMKVPIALGVGGGIDILAGAFSLAPCWVRKLGLAWFYRLLLEPRRMWKRYLITNSQFLWLFLKALAKRGEPS